MERFVCVCVSFPTVSRFALSFSLVHLVALPTPTADQQRPMHRDSTLCVHVKSSSVRSCNFSLHTRPSRKRRGCVWGSCLYSRSVRCVTLTFLRWSAMYDPDVSHAHSYEKQPWLREATMAKKSNNGCQNLAVGGCPYPHLQHIKQLAVDTSNELQSIH